MKKTKIYIANSRKVKEMRERKIWIDLMYERIKITASKEIQNMTPILTEEQNKKIYLNYLTRLEYTRGHNYFEWQNRYKLESLDKELNYYLDDEIRPMLEEERSLIIALDDKKKKRHNYGTEMQRKTYEFAKIIEANVTKKFEKNEIFSNYIESVIKMAQEVRLENFEPIYKTSELAHWRKCAIIDVKANVETAERLKDLWKARDAAYYNFIISENGDTNCTADEFLHIYHRALEWRRERFVDLLITQALDCLINSIVKVPDSKNIKIATQTLLSYRVHYRPRNEVIVKYLWFLKYLGRHIEDKIKLNPKNFKIKTIWD